MVLTATATFNVIVIHTFTAADRQREETFRRLCKGDRVSLSPGDRIYMAVDPRFTVVNRQVTSCLCLPANLSFSSDSVSLSVVHRLENTARTLSLWLPPPRVRWTQRRLHTRWHLQRQAP